jgi:hypothetical protein
MNTLRPNAIDEELERRLAILAAGESTDRRLPLLDALILVATTIGSFVTVAIAQAF